MKEVMRSVVDADHWQEMEIDGLRDDLECALMGEAVARQKQSRAEDRAIAARDNFNNLKKNFDDKITEKHAKLVENCMVYIDLIAEYETVLAVYAGYHGVKLNTTDITKLRKRGGLQV